MLTSSNTLADDCMGPCIIARASSQPCQPRKAGRSIAPNSSCWATCSLYNVPGNDYVFVGRWGAELLPGLTHAQQAACLQTYYASTAQQGPIPVATCGCKAGHARPPACSVVQGCQLSHLPATSKPSKFGQDAAPFGNPPSPLLMQSSQRLHNLPCECPLAQPLHWQQSALTWWYN